MAITKTQQVLQNCGNRPEVKWELITENDTPTSQKVPGGKYMCSVQGTFGGGSVEFQFSKTDTDYRSIDVTNLTFSAAGDYNVEIGEGYIKPVRTGGSSMDVDSYLTPIPNETA